MTTAIGRRRRQQMADAAAAEAEKQHAALMQRTDHRKEGAATVDRGQGLCVHLPHQLRRGSKRDISNGHKDLGRSDNVVKGSSRAEDRARD